MQILGTKAASLERFMGLYELENSTPAHIWDGIKYQDKLVTDSFINAIEDQKNWYQAKRIITLSFDRNEYNLEYFDDTLRCLIELLTASKNVVLFSYSASYEYRRIRILLSESSAFIINDLLDLPKTHDFYFRNDTAFLILKYLVRSEDEHYSLWSIRKLYKRKSKGIMSKEEKEKFIATAKKLYETYKGWEFEYRLRLILPYGYKIVECPTKLYLEDNITDIFHITRDRYLWTENKEA